jgi:hypothetical protein
VSSNPLSQTGMIAATDFLPPQKIFFLCIRTITIYPYLSLNPENISSDLDWVFFFYLGLGVA